MDRERLVAELRGALALAREGRYGEARAACDALLAVHPLLPPVLVLKGRLCRLQGDVTTGAYALDEALRTAPELYDAWSERAQLRIAMRDPSGALADWRRAARLRPEDGGTWFNLGLAAEASGELAEAIDAYRRVSAAGASDPEVGVRLATVLASAGRADEALQAADAVLAAAPDSAPAHCARGQALVSLGRMTEAREALETALVHDPDLAAAMQLLVDTRRIGARDDADFVRLEAALARGEPDGPGRTRLLYALAKGLDDLGLRDEAFAASAEANARRAKEGPAFDPPAWERRVRAIARTFDSRAPASAAPAGPVPVFVLGLPRSGTTLVEQILARHPDVATGGEDAWLDRLAHRELRPWPDAIASLSQEQEERLAGIARDHIRAAAGERRLALNKYPGNVFVGGLAARLLPEARFLRVRRHPLDTCLSIWLADFGGLNPYATDLSHIATWYRGCHELAEQWAAMYPAATVEVEYEALVSEPEAQVRRLLDALGLAWEPACLDPAAGALPVATLSAWQVRQPIHPRSVDRWRHYERHLAPLIDALADLLPEG
jgi:tetratricopeptide (TPR) repeat protein